MTPKHQFTLGLHREIFIDNFAGGGGASTGIERALRRRVDVALNHDRQALAMHRMNHPQTRHYCEDIRTADPVRIADGRPVGGVWFSPDCKHFSKAKGGKPRSKKIRGLAWVVIHWINKVRPRAIFLENVEEFQTWCPLTPDGKPSPWRKGWFFRCFAGALRRRGYAVEFQEARACDFGAPTIRKRFFLIARRDGLPIVWPVPTHGPAAPKPHRAVAECLDFSTPCPSIFLTGEEAKARGCKRPLATATLARIAKGIDRYVLESKRPFIVSLTHQGGDRVESVDAPLHTVAASPKDQNQFLTAHLVKLRGDNVGSDAREPLHTVSAQGTHHAVTACFLAQHNGGFNTTPGHDAREPLPTIASTGSQQQLVGASLIPYYGSEADRAGAGVGEPARTVTTRDRFGLVEVFGGCPHLTPEMEAGARRVAAFLRAHGVEFAGEFAAVAGGFVIVDIGMRMLRPRELYRAQGFPENYIIDRGLDRDTKTGRLAQIKLTKTAQVRMCGNSVCPPMAEALVRANLPDMIEEEAAA